MDFSEYIEHELLIIIPVLYVLGMMIKKSNINDKFIPIILGVMGIFLVSAYKLTSNLPQNASETFKIIYAGVTQGLLCASGSVYADNIVKQLKKKDKNDDTKGD